MGSAAKIPYVGTLFFAILLGWLDGRAIAHAPQVSVFYFHPIGVTASGKPIFSHRSKDWSDLNSKKTRVLAIGGLEEFDASFSTIMKIADWFKDHPDAKAFHDRYSLCVVLDVCPDPKTHAYRGYPPRGSFYNSPDQREAAYLWRWIAIEAPDLVIDLRPDDKHKETAVASEDPAWKSLIEERKISTAGTVKDELVAALAIDTAGELGSIPALRIHYTERSVETLLPSLLSSLDKAGFKGPSPARATLRKRLARTPRETFAALDKVYGHKMPSVQYIPAVAMIARLRGAADADRPIVLAELEKIVAPFYDGAKEYAPRTGSDFAGALVFAALADATAGERRARYIELVKRAADRAFSADGSPKPAMPGHSEMSDGVFMGGPILAAAGRLTGETKYFDACARHLEFMKKMLLRKDGIYRHSPLCDAAWGRGNGFVALGLTLVLRDFPTDYPARGGILRNYQDLMEELLEFQDSSGMWHQVIDQKYSYREFSATCMIAFSFQQGTRHKWLLRKDFEGPTDLAWRAIHYRIGDDGCVTDVCTGTGKQKSLRDYLDREAVLGRDDRGGAMALLFVAELLAAEGKAKEPAKP